MLEAVGLGADEERVYLQLVITFETDPVRLAARLEMAPDDVRRALGALHAKGLVRRTTDPESYTPTPPDVGFGPLLLAQQEALEGARRMVAQLGESYHESLRRRDAGQLVEVITGREALRQQLHDLQLGAREEVVALCKAGHVAMPSSDNYEEFLALEAGVRYRVIYEQALLEEPGMLDSVASSAAVGELARAAPEVPVRLMIADRRLGICPLVPVGEGFGEPTAALVRDSSLLTALLALFDSYWERASPLFPDGDTSADGDVRASPLKDDDRQMLSLLVAGVADKAIASRLGISQRTVQRRIAELLQRAGAQTRAQLAWQAARLGWLD